MEVASPVPVAVGLIVGVAARLAFLANTWLMLAVPCSNHEPCSCQSAHCFQSLSSGQIFAKPLLQIHSTLFHCYK